MLTQVDNTLTNEDIVAQVYTKSKYKVVGSISRAEAHFLLDLISQKKPKTIVEIGVASGRSSAVLALSARKDPNIAIHSFDIIDTYYGDPELPTGFLINEFLDEESKQLVKLHLGDGSVDVDTHLDGNQIELAFIDANHQHPWPTLDTIALLPFLSHDAIVVHHDLTLFREPKYRHGVGPKFLYDSLSSHRILLPNGTSPLTRVKENIYAFRVDKTDDSIIEELADSLLMPRTTFKKLDEETRFKFDKLIKSNINNAYLTQVWEAVSPKL